ncbi:LAFE_0B06678g1_1 [Lachancea fermentati]|uniref:LAFE_0B06678g1_1 n=1 Tax=Lachancea fermentati TaxID=4955 RepID=A0A1G4M808_LACFM|nr:LAFE_0B06678g1_1 [Lachancea fermentati]
MLFGVKLANQVYPPWRSSYIDYERLKKLLKESVLNEDGMSGQSTKNKKSEKDDWSEKDESNFVSALDAELEKVYGFQVAKYNAIMERLVRLEKKTDDEEAMKTLDFNAFQHMLEESLSEAQELDNFSRLNYTGFIKIVKKHDKLHPKYPSVKSLLQVRLKELPFHSEEYSPLLYKISFLYNILRNSFPSMSKSLANSSKLSSVTNGEDMSFQSYTFWIHPDNLMEVKTRILRHLPVLVYASAPTENDDLIDRIESSILNSNISMQTPSSSSSVADGDAIGNKTYDPVIRTIYFDNDFFELYNNKLLKTNSSPTLRLRWTGKLADKPDMFLEKRMFVEDSETGISDFDEVRLKLKPKFINGFIFNGDDEFKEKTLKKLKDRGTVENEIDKVSNDFDNIKKFVLENELQPMLRAMYTRTAFQIPGDDRIRITIDSDLMYVREDSLDKDRPIRDPKNWHRSDIDADVANPMKFLRPGEYSKFPYSVMDIRIRNSFADAKSGQKSMIQSQLPRKHGKWIEELTNSHLVKEVPKFSKYTQGVASLFGDDDNLDMLPFWLPDLETDIRIDPKQAYEEEKKKLEEQKENQARIAKIRRISAVPTPGSVETAVEQLQAPELQSKSSDERGADLDDHESSDEDESDARSKKLKKKQNRDANFFRILAGRQAKLTGVDSEEEEVELPPGVKKPTSYLKNAGPVKVEAKVWLANERTFNRWLSLTSLMSVLTFSIYNSLKRAEFPNLARFLAYVYFGITIFTGVWSYRTYLTRLTVIRERSGKHLDAPFGPLLIATMLTITLVVNFVLAFREAASKRHDALNDVAVLTVDELPRSLERILNFVFAMVGAKVPSSN